MRVNLTRVIPPLAGLSDPAQGNEANGDEQKQG